MVNHNFNRRCFKMARAKWVDFVFAVLLAIALLFTVKTEAAAAENEGKNVQPIPISINY